MRTILFLGVLSAIPRLLYAQSLTFQGSVVEKNGRAPIPYASVRLIKEKASTGADDKGTFKLGSSHPVENDSLLISAIGYRPVKIPVTGFVQRKIIELEEDTQFLKEVKVSAKAKRKRSILNPLSVGRVEGKQWVYSGYTQIARKFTAPKEFSRLEQVSLKRFLTIKHPFANQNCRFRIRVYGADDITGAPAMDLNHQVIEVEETIPRQIITVDLTKYNIIIPKREFFVAIEWLYIGFNESMQLSLEPVYASRFESDHASSAAILRYDIEYEPRIDCMDYDNMFNAYQQLPNGTWKHLGIDINSGPAISAVLAYTVLKK